MKPNLLLQSTNPSRMFVASTVFAYALAGASVVACSSGDPSALDARERVAQTEEELNLELCTSAPPAQPGPGVCENASNWNNKARPVPTRCPPSPTNRDGTGCTQIVLGRFDCFAKYAGCPGYVALNVSPWTQAVNDAFVACAAADRLGATCDAPIYVCSKNSDIPDPGGTPDGGTSGLVTTGELCQLKASGCHVLLNENAPGAVADCPKTNETNQLAPCNAPGDPLGYYRGVTLSGYNDFVQTYCNDPAGAGVFQCDQFANRFVSSMDLPPLDDYVNDYACQICDRVSASPVLSQYYSVWGPGYQVNAGHKPQSNDLLVFDEGVCSKSVAAPGHVAVVTGADANNIYYIQQNWTVSGSVGGSRYASVPRASTAWNASTSFFGDAGGPGGPSFHPRCWVHPECPPYTSCNPGPTHNPCAGVSRADNGVYCGGSNQAGFNTNYADKSILYTCFDGQIANEIACATGCTIEGAGLKDHCSPPKDPCNAVPHTFQASGFYCGTSKQNNFNSNGTADSTSLYDCENGSAAHVATCAHGCFVSTTGNDGCNLDPCQSVSSASNGLYCGSSPHNGFFNNVTDWNTVYNCENQMLIASASCGPAGCVTASGGVPGTPDYCVVDPCAKVPTASNGRFCGSSTQNGFGMGLVADKRLVYMCKGQKTAWTERCPRGCYVAKAGQDDGCL